MAEFLNQNANTNKYIASSRITATSAIANSDTLISIGLVVPANYLTAGSHIKVTVAGTFTAASAVNAVFNLRSGTANTVADASLGTFSYPTPSSGTNIPFWISHDVTIRTIGASGTLYGAGGLINSNGSTGILNGQATSVVIGSPANINTTEARYLNMSFVSGHASNSGTIQICIIEVFKQ